MGDLLKSKIQRRPDRQELIQQHILEDSNVAPSLQDKQRQLKKARLADDLNERLSHRPGPLELVEENILQTDECFAQAVRGGHITFKKTCEGETRKHPPPLFVFEEDSSSGEAALSPLHDSDQSQVGSVQSPAEAVVISAIGSPGLGSAASSLSPVSSVASPASSFIQSPVAASAGIASSSTLATSSSSSLATTAAPTLVTLSAPTKLNLANHVLAPSTSSSSPPTRAEAKSEHARNRKKSKSKSSPKTRTIKFHEYKGPPNAQKMQASNASSVESSYELLLQQQQLFLQWQLEWQHKYPQIILPASQKTNGTESPANLMSPTSFANSYPGQVLNGCTQSQPDCNSAIRFISKLEDMKVSDLKAECKRRNLPVSGSKPQLIERLKPYSDMTPSTVAILMSASSPLSDPSNHPSTSNTQLASGPLLLEGGQTSQGGGGAECLPNEESLSMTPLEAASSPTSPPGLNNDMNTNSLTAALLSDSMDSMDSIPSGQYHSPAGSSAGGSGPPSLQRPPSVAPMDVDACGLDAMEVGDVERTLSFGEPLTIAAAMALLNANNGFQKSESEEKLRKKIEALQHELQKSQMELQQHQRKQALLGHQTPPHTPQTPPPCNSALQQDVKPNMASMQVQQPLNAADQKLQQKLMLQQHLQQRIQHQQLLQLQQQQQQQQQQALQMSRPQSASSPAKANLAAFLHGNANALQHQAKQQFFNFSSSNNNNNNNNNNNSNGSSHQQQQQLYDDVEGTGHKPRTSPLPNGLGHIRTNSLPNFLGSVGCSQKVPMTRASTDLQIVITQPPPDYDEATKQLNKQQFAQTLISTLANPQSGRKSFKSQAVDDVLEILIKNGELPPSAAQEPPTPPTPKSLPSGLIVFPSSTQSLNVPGLSSVSTSAMTSSAASTCPTWSGATVSRTQSLPSRSPSQTHPTVVGVLNSTSPAMSPHHRKHSTTTSEGGDLDSPGSVCHAPPSLDLDFNLDLEGLEPMNLENLPRDNHVGNCNSKVDAHDLAGLVNGVSDQSNHHLHDMLDLNDTMHMDIDWLENVIPSDELSALGNCNSAVTSVVPGSAADCGDPLLSTNQDPFDLFSMDENDYKNASDLSTLGWDKVDFAT